MPHDSYEARGADVGVRALVLGIGLGALFSRWLATAAGLIIVIGLVLHAFGMWDKHRLAYRPSIDGHRR